MRHHNPDDGPCRPMQPLLDAAADGRSKGFRVWYARLHAARCPGCNRYLATLMGMVSGLRGARLESEPEDEGALERLSKKLTS